MKHTVMMVALLAACGGGEKKPEPTTVSNSRGSAEVEAASRPAPEKPRDRTGEMISAFNGFADAVCTCVDKPGNEAAECAQAVSNQFAKEFTQHDDDKPTPEEMARFAKATVDAQKRMTECITKIATQAAGSAATP